MRASASALLKVPRPDAAHALWSEAIVISNSEKYAPTTVVARQPDTVVFRGVRLEDGRAVVVKQLQPGAPPRAPPSFRT